ELYPKPPPVPPASAEDAARVHFSYVIPRVGAAASTHMFNPCLPAISDACMKHPPGDADFAPFKDKSRQPDLLPANNY
ncbi:MAG TPA: hypothetical protein VF752_02525, partial [Thermoleophilaceae bacterium]